MRRTHETRSELARRWMAFTLFFAGACHNNTSEACAIIRGDPLISLAEARNAANGSVVPEVIIRGAKVQGQPLSAVALINFPPSTRVTPTTAGLHCQIACGFGAHEGDYELIIGTAGFRDTTIAFRATYAALTDGCPRKQVGSHTLRVVLRPVEQ